jgi:hypothetical protein
MSLGFQKPAELRYRNLMDSHGKSLLQEESSAEVSSLVKLQRLAERIAEVHQSFELKGDPQMEALNAEVNIQMFQHEVQEWQKSVPTHVRNLRKLLLISSTLIVCFPIQSRCILNGCILILILAVHIKVELIPAAAFIGITERYLGCAIYSHELGFLRRPYRDHLRSMASSPPANPLHLESCLQAAKAFCEYLLSLPETIYINLTAVQWSMSVHVILVLSRITFVMAANLGWDSDTTRSNVPLVMYLDALCYRFEHLSSTPSDTAETPKNPDVFYVFRMILKSCKKSYERRVAKIEPGFLVVDHANVISTAARGHCPILDPALNSLFDLSDSTYGGSYGLSESATPSTSSMAASLPQYHDVWAVMTGSWAEEF